MTSDYTPPCHESPEDWFLARDGRQYPDDELVSTDEQYDIAEEMLLADPEVTQEAYELRLETLEADRKAAALVRRRHAKDACFTCYFRLQCLTLAIDGVERHGTWGGYYEEELREIRRLRDERAQRE